jgi:PAS domain-containing protein
MINCEDCDTWMRERRCRRSTKQEPRADSVGVIMQGASGSILVASEQAARLLGVNDPADMAGQPSVFGQGCAIRPDGSEFPEDEQPAALALRTGQKQDDCLIGLRRGDAPTRWFRVRAEPLFNVGSAVPYAVVSRLLLVESTPSWSPRRGVVGAMVARGCPNYADGPLGHRGRISQRPAQH